MFGMPHSSLQNGDLPTCVGYSQHTFSPLPPPPEENLTPCRPALAPDHCAMEGHGLEFMLTEAQEQKAPYALVLLLAGCNDIATRKKAGQACLPLAVVRGAWHARECATRPPREAPHAAEVAVSKWCFGGRWAMQTEPGPPPPPQAAPCGATKFKAPPKTPLEAPQRPP